MNFQCPSFGMPNVPKPSIDYHIGIKSSLLLSRSRWNIFVSSPLRKKNANAIDYTPYRIPVRSNNTPGTLQYSWYTGPMVDTCGRERMTRPNVFNWGSKYTVCICLGSHRFIKLVLCIEWYVPNILWYFMQYDSAEAASWSITLIKWETESG